MLFRFCVFPSLSAGRLPGFVPAAPLRVSASLIHRVHLRHLTQRTRIINKVGEPRPRGGAQAAADPSASAQIHLNMRRCGLGTPGDAGTAANDQPRYYY